ncbi:SWIM zinc finger family protein [Paenibacillus sp. Marseille-Q4541]|uniref:SWIM zinc finger family protein n=1 Tax=Paenibacillus sp. Marseille-Q4541 TaxID=2831522 RepID=UPI001BABB6D4|nr:SWIM zinc finger family protein [Paenibacillus sp. Marseille-Q4541]
MNLKYMLDETEWQILVQKVGESFNDLTIKRGFEQYKQERAHLIKISNPEHIKGFVEGNDEERYQVTLNLDTLSDSHCTCPVPSYCKHMIAVLLAYVSQYGRSVHAMVNANSAATFKQPDKPAHLTNPARSSGQQTSSSEPQNRVRKTNTAEQLQLQELANKLPSMPIQDWHAFFKLCTSSVGSGSPNVQYAKEALASIYNQQPELSPVLDQLYKLHALLFVLDKLVRPLQNSEMHRNIFIGYHTQVAADDVQEEIIRILTEPLMIRDEPELWSRVSETSDYLRSRMLVESSNLRYFSVAYDSLWLHWIHPNLKDKSMYEEELEQLLSAEDELKTSLAKLPWWLAQSQIHFFLDQDQPALELLQQANQKGIIPPERFFLFLQILSSKGQWSRLQDWLLAIGPMMLSRPREQHIQEYVNLWEQVIQHSSSSDSEQHLWNSLIHMLPFSRKIYEETLLAHSKWQQWMDYQLSSGTEPLDFRVSVLKPIEKNAPELLLPFYHQGVERYILLKNRDSYKAAVKLLKRLSKLYLKMKQETRWEQFITTFANRHSRLRALQEELRKGKLIP